MIIYNGQKKGNSGPQDVYIQDGGVVQKLLKQSLVKHSPDGFQWGYSGSGPLDLALNILYDFYNRYYSFMFDSALQEFAQKHYKRFTEDFVSKWENKWEITNEQIQEWLITEAKKNRS
jgi:hypothetical protein